MRAAGCCATNGRDGVITYLGAMVPGFPNFFMAGGPHLIAGNFPRATEIMVDYITGVLRYARANGHTYVAPDGEASRGVDRRGARAPPRSRSWPRTRGSAGPTSPAKPMSTCPYAGSLTKFRERMDVMEEQGYPGLVFGTPVRA